MSCPIAQSEGDAKSWVGETLWVESCSGEKGYEFPGSCLELFKDEKVSAPSLRIRFSERRRRDHRDSEESLAKFDFIFCLDHHFVDGVGVRLVAGCFFEFLADALFLWKHLDQQQI